MTNPVTPPPYTPGGAVPPAAGGVPSQFVPPAQPGAAPAHGSVPPQQYGAQPQYGSVPPPGSVPPATEGFGPAPEKPKSGAGKKILAVVAVVIVALVVIGFKVAVGEFFAEDAKTKDVAVGDCITEAPEAKDMSPVACGDATAAHKVAGKVDGITEAGFEADQELSLCKPYPTTEGALWSGEAGGKGYVLCLEPVKE